MLITRLFIIALMMSSLAFSQKKKESLSQNAYVKSDCVEWKNRAMSTIEAVRERDKWVEDQKEQREQFKRKSQRNCLNFIQDKVLEYSVFDNTGFSFNPRGDVSYRGDIRNIASVSNTRKEFELVYNKSCDSGKSKLKEKRFIKVKTRKRGKPLSLTLKTQGIEREKIVQYNFDQKRGECSLKDISVYRDFSDYSAGKINKTFSKKTCLEALKIMDEYVALEKKLRIAQEARILFTKAYDQKQSTAKLRAQYLKTRREALKLLKTRLENPTEILEKYIVTFSENRLNSKTLLEKVNKLLDVDSNEADSKAVESWWNEKRELDDLSFQIYTAYSSDHRECRNFESFQEKSPAILLDAKGQSKVQQN